MPISNIKDQKSNIKQNKNSAAHTEFNARIKQLMLQLIQFVDMLPHDRVCDVIGRQIIRSGTSIGANYFEAKAASSRKDYTNFFNYSLKSANESIFWVDTDRSGEVSYL